MPDQPRNGEKAKAWSTMKAAVRAYAHDPSGHNMVEVESACSRLRRVETDSLLARGQAAAAAPGGGPLRSEGRAKD
ncbi:MAG: hypothetical protein QNJ30_02660 [Kiloniellales bacterium]|nr:hypothetical protein [Kiloniellales bacterium]